MDTSTRPTQCHVIPCRPNQICVSVHLNTLTRPRKCEAELFSLFGVCVSADQNYAPRQKMPLNKMWNAKNVCHIFICHPCDVDWETNQVNDTQKEKKKKKKNNFTNRRRFFRFCFKHPSIKWKKTLCICRSNHSLIKIRNITAINFTIKCENFHSKEFLLENRIWSVHFLCLVIKNAMKIAAAILNGVFFLSSNNMLMLCVCAAFFCASVRLERVPRVERDCIWALKRKLKLTKTVKNEIGFLFNFKYMPFS